MAVVTSGPVAQARPDAAATVERLRRTFATGRTRDVAWRLRQLGAIERLLTQREDDIVAALGADLGRDAHNAWFGDIASTRAEAAHARRHLRGWARPRRTSLPVNMLPGRGFYQYEPLGVVLVVGPWNYPVYLTLSPLVGALAAGNAVVVKPSEHAPATSALLARLLPEYLDADAVAVCEGDATVTRQLVAQGLDHVFFTGGTETGKQVMEAAARHLTPVTLELGGKSPVIVTPDADLDVAAQRIVSVKLLNAGQTCIAPDYVLVDSSVRDEFVARVRATLERFERDEPVQRIVNARQFDRLRRVLDGHRGQVVVGGGGDPDTITVEATVVLDPDPASELMTQEIFGPILPVLTVGSLDEAIAFVNARPKPLALYLFTGSKTVVRRVLRETSSGGVVVNHLAVHVLVPQLPFGGVGDSGIGAYHGRWGFEALSHRRAVVTKPARPDPPLLYPPRTAWKKKLLRRLF
ncbi:MULTISPECIES: aldehyde dehydrogenase family protein [Protofrankia]|uniref:Aldehyde dehydrogenase n=1 Tax=Protofrankia coriariae TaxID=1562887 RepID=A0ABR5F0W3_9ACTN|nr:MULTISPECIES: aldehyde dehydrogenase family protein [Protofrankia]KLL10360.1 aldehyde dehydrogenase [Protofrankia coriariae]ONH31352.1 aldehyde dehydrogenase family protein [Protofrankia sp. BMG5.30]